jgi:hypothetical protein
VLDQDGVVPPSQDCRFGLVRQPTFPFRCHEIEYPLGGDFRSDITRRVTENRQDDVIIITLVVFHWEVFRCCTLGSSHTVERVKNKENDHVCTGFDI